MLEINGMEVPRTLDDLLDPRRVALIVYDMQVGITRQVSDRERVLQRVACALNSARQAGVRTFFTRHLSLPKQLMGSMQYRTAMAWQHTDDPTRIKSPFLRDSASFAIEPELQPRDSEAVFDKITMSAFEGTPLAIALRDCGVRAIVIVGIAVEIGIEPTARHAADLGFVPILVRDACGHGNAEAAARSWQSLQFCGDAIISDTERICNAWSNPL